VQIVAVSQMAPLV